MTAPFAIDPGALRHRLTLETASEAPDGGGGLARTWTPLATLWAAIEPETPGPDVVAERAVGAVRHRVTLRTHPGVAPRRRFRTGARLLLIDAAVDPDGRGRWLVCRCREVQS